MLLESGDLSPEPPQVALDQSELGLRSPMPIVAIVGALHKRLKLAPEEPQPWIPVNDTDSILELTRVNRSLDLVLCQPELLTTRAVLSLSVAPFRRQSSSTGCSLPALLACNITPPDRCPIRCVHICRGSRYQSPRGALVGTTGRIAVYRPGPGGAPTEQLMTAAECVTEPAFRGASVELNRREFCGTPPRIEEPIRVRASIRRASVVLVE